MTNEIKILGCTEGLVNEGVERPSSAVNKSRTPGRPGASICTVVTNICGFSVWNLLHLTFLAPRILRWLQLENLSTLLSRFSEIIQDFGDTVYGNLNWTILAWDDVPYRDKLLLVLSPRSLSARYNLPVPPLSPHRRQTTRLEATLSLHICINSSFLRPKQTSPKRWSISNLSTQLSMWTEYLDWMLAAKTEVGLFGGKTRPTATMSTTKSTRTNITSNYIWRFSSYRAVNTSRLGYKNQSVNVV